MAYTVAGKTFNRFGVLSTLAGNVADSTKDIYGLAPDHKVFQEGRD